MKDATPFKKITKAMFDRYCKVQHSGLYNMIAEADRAACAAKLTIQQYMGVIEYYGDLADKYGKEDPRD